MLKRIALVIWWLGAIFLALGIGIQPFIQGGIVAKQDAPDCVNEYLAHAASGVPISHRCEAAAAEPERQPATFDDRAPTLAFGLLSATILWTVAFVLGGSFWRPPRTT